MAIAALRARSASPYAPEPPRAHPLVSWVARRASQGAAARETPHLCGGADVEKTRYEYVGTVEEGGRTLDKIASKILSVSYMMEPNPTSPAEVTKSDLTIASSKGTLLFDRELGRTVRDTSEVRMTGDMTIKIGPMELPTKLDLTIATETALKPAAK